MLNQIKCRKEKKANDFSVSLFILFHLFLVRGRNIKLSKTINSQSKRGKKHSQNFFQLFLIQKRRTLMKANVTKIK